MIAEPTRTDGCRVLCHQFSPSSLSLQGSWINRCSTCWLRMKHLRAVILPLWSIGVQGQSTPHMVFPLQSGRSWCSV